MYRVLIADDEKYIRKSIINRVEWEECNTTVVAEAEDGLEAYELVMLHDPHIVITDIRMPGMDGLELAERISQEAPHIRVIVISAYSDFDYARKAIRHGVKDYLLKPVDEEELQTVLERLTGEIMECEEKLQLPEVTVSQAEEETGGKGSFVMISFWMEKQKEDGCSSSENAVFEKVTELAGEENQFWYYREGMEKQCSFLWKGENITRRTAEQLVERVLMQLGKETVQYAGISSVFKGECLDGQMLVRLQTEAVGALKNKIFQQKQIFVFQLQEVRVPMENYRKELQLLGDLYAWEDWENLEKAVRKMIRERLYDTDRGVVLEYLIGELLFVLRGFSRKLGHLYEMQVLFHDLRKTDYLLQFESIEELSGTMEELTDTIFSYWKESRRQGDVLEDICKYIQHHFMEDLTVGDLARQYHMNSTYLSTSFKERHNISLSAYIEGIRMEKAKVFLKEDLGNITEIALRAGYADSNYFTKVFKKYTGMTPREWRKSESTFCNGSKHDL